MGNYNVFISLDSFDTAIAFCKICDKYDFDINIEYGSYVIDGKSILGVASLVGKIVKIVPITDNNEQLEDFISEIKKIGAYTITNGM